MTAQEKLELTIHRQVFNLTAEKLRKTPWWKFKERMKLRGILRTAYHHIKLLNNNKNMIP